MNADIYTLAVPRARLVMRLLAFCFAFFCHLSLCSAQLLPEVPLLQGNVEYIIEPNYGKEVYLFNRWTGIYLRGWYSGWTNKMWYNDNNTLKREIHEFKNKLRSDVSMVYDTTGGRVLLYKVRNDNTNDQRGDVTQTEYVKNTDGNIEQINTYFESYKEGESPNIITDQIRRNSIGQVTSYVFGGSRPPRSNDPGTLFEIEYDSLSNMVQVEREEINFRSTIVPSKDMKHASEIIGVLISKPTTDQKTTYIYDKKGRLFGYLVQNLGALYLNEPDVYWAKDKLITFKYDRRGNWKRRYLTVEGTGRTLIAKRKIRYR